MEKITSALYRLGLSDTIEGLKMAVGGALVAWVMPILNAWAEGQPTPSMDIKTIWHTSAAAAGIYLTKKFFTPAQIIKPAN